MEKEYLCICGKKFNNSQSFNAHKGHCKTHQLNKYGTLDNLYETYKNRGKCIQKSLVQKNNKIKKEKQEKELKQWILEKHRCEICNCVMTEKFGSGRFCSRSCSNKRKYSEEIKQKISIGVKNYNEFNNIVDCNHNNKYYVENYYQNPKICIVCNKIIPYKIKHRKTCCDECLKNLRSSRLKGNIYGGYRENSGNTHFHKGYYKGYFCDSTWELVYI